MEFYCFDTPLGQMGAEEEGGAVVRLYLPGRPVPRQMPHPTPLLLEVEAQLTAYAQGKLTQFSLPLSPKGTPFQQRVWDALCTIPYGQTRSYGEIAQQIDCPKGSRAVGMANNKNPIPILIPCHRVIGSNKKLVGYAGGLELKTRLLKLEGWRG